MGEAKKEHQAPGLGKDWKGVEDVLERIVPVYDKTNRYISLGSDLKLREEGVKLLLEEVRASIFYVLDIGAGPGKMTQSMQHLLSNSSPPTKQAELSVLIDALPPMLKLARERVPSSDCVVGIYENLPLQSGTFDCLMAGFAIRDARDLTASLHEIARVLKHGGKFLIVDLSKPDSQVRNFFIATYWRIFAPMIAFIVSGRMGLKFSALSRTYQKLPSSSVFKALLQDAGLEVLREKRLMFDGATILLLSKKGE